MARKRQRKKNRAREEGPHGDGMGEQGDLLAAGGEKEPPEAPAGGEAGIDASGDVEGSEAVEEVEEVEESEEVEEVEPEPAPDQPESEADEPAPEADAPEPAEQPAPESSDEPAPAADHDAPEPAEPDESREARERARELVEAGQVREAVDAYRRIVAENPRDLKARNNLGVLYDELGQHELALEQLDAAAELDPEHVEVMTNRGAALTALGRFAEAEEELRRAQRIYPEDVGVRSQLGILLFRRGLYAQAETELRWVCTRAEGHGPAHYYRGEALNRLGRVDEAIEALERAVALQPRNARAYYTLGILFDRKHMPDEAARMYRKSRELQG